MTSMQRRLQSYYEKQEAPGLCGVASVTIVINALYDQHRVRQPYLTYHVPNVRQVGMRLAGVSELLRNHDCYTEINRHHKGRFATINRLRDLLRRQQCNDDTMADTVVIVNYWQPTLGVERRLGHFSPLGGYDKKRDKVLLLDVGCNTPCNPRYVSLKRLWRGMMKGSDEQGSCRGFILVSKLHPTDA